MLIGLRVVRGPDWSHGEQDGGEDHVGTVIEVMGGNSVKVMWDMGLSTVYRAGSGSFDLRVFDGAPVGICHKGIVCSGCQDVGIYGTIWRCSTCSNVTLCSVCYHSDQHEIGHEFVRVDFPNADHLAVPKRMSSQRSRSLGIFPNSTVARGLHWEYGDQDGGAEKQGVVEDIVSFGKDASDRNAARVTWHNRQTHVYRLGYAGKVDLKCIEESPGATFYRNHLAVLDVEKFSAWGEIEDILTVGDSVCVTLSIAELRALHQTDWNNRYEEIIGEIGTVEEFTNEGNVVISYEDDTITVNKAAVAKLPSFATGDVVKVTSSKEKCRRLQRNHGGWDDEMIEVLGTIGKVNIIDKDGDIGVIFEDKGKAFVYHPSCLTLVQGFDGDGESDTDSENEESVLSDSDEDNGKEEEEDDDETVGNSFLQMFAGLALLQALAEASEQNVAQQFVNAVQENKPEDVKALLEDNPELKHVRVHDIPILTVAAFEGHVEVVKILLNGDANIDAIDPKGNTALLIAVFLGRTDVAQLLLAKGANCEIVNLERRTATHGAAQKGLTNILKILLDKGCNPNEQDSVGDTPLHDAISDQKDETVTLLLSHPKTNVFIQNAKQFNAMHMACLKDHAFAVDKLLSKEPSLASIPKADGFAPLHICAFNNHIKTATILLIKARVDVDPLSVSDNTPLMLAAAEGFYDMCKLLLEHGADFNKKNEHGNTPLHLCMFGKRSVQPLIMLLGLRSMSEDMERVKIANFLYQHGANLETTNNDGKTPISICNIEHIKVAVLDFAAKNKPLKPEPRQTRPKTAKVEKEMFTKAKQKCHKCSQNDADIKFEPCKHKVSCRKCCFQFKSCPICRKVISKRLDNENKQVSSEACVIL